MTLWLWLLVGAGAVFVLYGLFVLWLYVQGRHSDARAVAGFVPDCVILFGRLIRDPRVPRRKKLVLVLTAGYLATPIDLVPDVIPVAGQLDDAILVALVMRSLLRSDRELVTEHWPGPPQSLQLLLKLGGHAA